jgi:hypothetical protein
MSTDNEAMRKTIEESDMSPGRKKLALRLLERRERREARTAAPAPLSRVTVPAESFSLNAKSEASPLPQPAVPFGRLLAAVGASSAVGGLLGALIGSALS